MKRKIFIYNSFTKTKFKGNPAGVVFDADELKDEDMQKLAKELNYPETAFLFFKNNDIIQVRFFTPKTEIDLCGHATIAYITALIEENRIKIKDGVNKIFIKTNLGIFPILVEKKDNEIVNIMMYQDSPRIDDSQNFSDEEIARLLGIEKDYLEKKIKVVKAYTGVWDLMICVKNKEILQNLKPKLDEISKFSIKNRIISFHIFTLTGEEIEARNLAPSVDIPEEAATGTSNGALGYYLYILGLLNENTTLKVIQGRSMNRTSEIFIKILKENNEVKVLVGGKAVKLIEGYIEI